jgi:hypothetical protein
MAPRKKVKKSPLAFLDLNSFIPQVVEDKIYDCIIGSALRDTISLYTEFSNKKQSDGIYFGRKFQFVEPATELYPDSHRCKYQSSFNDIKLICHSSLYAMRLDRRHRSSTAHHHVISAQLYTRSTYEEAARELCKRAA